MVPFFSLTLYPSFLIRYDRWRDEQLNSKIHLNLGNFSLVTKMNEKQI